MRDHLLQVQETTGVIPKELEEAQDYPQQLEYLITWYWDMASGRQSGMSVNPLSWAEIESWGRLLGIYPDQWEVRTLREMDRAFLEHVRKKSSGSSKPKHTGGNVPAAGRRRAPKKA